MGLSSNYVSCVSFACMTKFGLSTFDQQVNSSPHLMCNIISCCAAFSVSRDKYILPVWHSGGPSFPPEHNKSVLMTLASKNYVPATGGALGRFPTNAKLEDAAVQLIDAWRRPNVTPLSIRYFPAECTVAMYLVYYIHEQP